MPLEAAAGSINTVITANKHKTKLPPVQDNQAPATLPDWVQIQKNSCKVVNREKSLKQLVYTVWVCWKAMITEKTIKEEMH